MTLRFLLPGTIVACATAFAGAPLALADGYARPAAAYVVPAPFISWTGLYVGGHVGGAWSDVNWANVNLTGERVNNDASGVIGGGQIGYNVQFGAVVLGAEAT